MFRHTGRAAMEVGRTLHHASHFLLTLVVLLTVGIVAGAWRLSRGPVDLSFLKDRVERSINSGISPVRVTIGGASVAWGGFSHGLDQPLVLRLTDVTVDTATGSSRVHIPAAEAALSARWLLIGRILPRMITLDGPRLVLVRNPDGSLSFGIGGTGDEEGASPLTGLLGVLGAPAETDLQVGGGRFSQLSAVAIHGATLRLDDRLWHMTWTAERADIDLSRHRGGGMDGRVTIDLVLGGQHAELGGNFNLAAGGRSSHVAARLSRVTPKALAASVPVLAPLAALDMPLTLEGDADLGADLVPAHIRLTARAGTGKIDTEAGGIPVHAARFTVAGTLHEATLEDAVVELQPAPDAAITSLGVSGQLTHDDGRLEAALRLTLDHFSFADLPALWPADINPPTRAWVIENVLAGAAHDGKAELRLATPDTGLDVTVINATGSLEGDNVVATWLPTVPAVERAKTHLVLTDPDKIELEVRSARQRVNGADPIAIPFGHVTVSGLSANQQVATIQCEANGSIPSAIALLKEPRLRLLDRHPMDLRAPAGEVRMSIHAVVPLLLNLRIDDLSLHAAGTLSKVHLAAIAAGRDLDDGTFSLDVDTNRLAIKGMGRLAGIQANIDGMMDFRAGPPSQVLQHFAVSGQATGQALTDAGLDTEGALTGEVGLNLNLNEYRNGDGELVANADLTHAAMTLSPLGWRKPVGGAAKGSVRVTLSKEKLTGIDRIAIDGPEIQVRGAVTVFGGKLDTVRLDRLVLGRTDVKGTVRLPRDGPIGVDVAGPALDVSAKLLEKRPKRVPAAPEPPAGPAWSVRGRFDRVLLAHEQTASQVVVTADDDGRIIRGLAVTGKTSSGKPFSMRVLPGQSGKGPAARRLAINVEDAGGLLQGLDVTKEIVGGALTIAGDFDDTARNHPLSGTLELTDFRVTHAPALGKLLQAVTLYGLVDALSGPGLGFTRLTAPFQLDDDTLLLHDARAFSPSLGLTARGKIDRDEDRLDLRGTVVPAYVFNSLLGRIPFFGGLFSVEKGGGLFAMNYSLQGPMDDPNVVANPLSALTPGILRGMFGLFGRTPVDQSTAPGNFQPQ